MQQIHYELNKPRGGGDNMRWEINIFRLGDYKFCDGIYWFMYGWAESEPGEVINEEDQLSITDSMEIGSLRLLYIIQRGNMGIATNIFSYGVDRSMAIIDSTWRITFIIFCVTPHNTPPQ